MTTCLGVKWPLAPWPEVSIRLSGRAPVSPDPFLAPPIRPLRLAPLTFAIFREQAGLHLALPDAREQGGGCLSGARRACCRCCLSKSTHRRVQNRPQPPSSHAAFSTGHTCPTPILASRQGLMRVVVARAGHFWMAEQLCFIILVGWVDLVMWFWLFRAARSSGPVWPPLRVFCYRLPAGSRCSARCVCGCG